MSAYNPFAYRKVGEEGGNRPTPAPQIEPVMTIAGDFVTINSGDIVMSPVPSET